MSTKLDYRTDLQTKLLALEDGSYGDFEYSTTELDTYVELAVARLFPSVYRRVGAEDLTVVQYGTNLFGKVTDDDAIYERVFLVEDADERSAIVGWEARPDAIIGLDTEVYTSVTIWWTDAYTLPTGENTPTGIPAIYEPLINLGALIEALEARQDTGVRGEPAPTGPFFQTQLLDRLKPRYDDLKAELTMALPAMVV